MAKSHPHVDRPDEARLRDVIENKSPALSQVYLAAHRLVLETLPDVGFSVDLVDGQIGYGERQYGYDGWGMAALAPYKGWVSLAFLRATSLDDPSAILEGTGSTVRHVKIDSLERLNDIRPALRELIEAAARLNG